MGILSDFKTLISEAMENEIRVYIKETCPGVRDRCMLPELKEWFAKNVKAWLTDMYGKGELALDSAALSRLNFDLSSVERPDSAWRKFEQFMLKELNDLR